MIRVYYVAMIVTKAEYLARAQRAARKWNALHETRGRPKPAPTSLARSCDSRESLSG